jgi:rubrerythrin
MIEKLAGRMREEMNDCIYYAEYAVKYKETCPELASLYRVLSEKEHSHAVAIYDAAKKIAAKEEWEEKLLEYEKSIVDERAEEARKLWAKIK